MKLFRGVVPPGEHTSDNIKSPFSFLKDSNPLKNLFMQILLQRRARSIPWKQLGVAVRP